MIFPRITTPSIVPISHQRQETLQKKTAVAGHCSVSCVLNNYFFWALLLKIKNFEETVCIGNIKARLPRLPFVHWSMKYNNISLAKFFFTFICYKLNLYTNFMAFWNEFALCPCAILLWCRKGQRRPPYLSHLQCSMEGQSVFLGTVITTFLHPAALVAIAGS